ncbi:MAG: hypothetical protein ACK5NW_02780 [Ottowia sp.]
MQQAVVALMVVLALLYVVWKYLPARWRQRLAARLGLSERMVQGGGCHDCHACDAPRAAPCTGAEKRSES